MTSPLWIPDGTFFDAGLRPHHLERRRVCPLRGMHWSGHQGEGDLRVTAAADFIIFISQKQRFKQQKDGISPYFTSKKTVWQFGFTKKRLKVLKSRDLIGKSMSYTSGKSDGARDDW